MLLIGFSSLYQSRTQTHFRVTSRWFEMWLTSREAVHKRDHRVPDSIRRKDFQVPTTLTNTPLILNHSWQAIYTGGRYVPRTSRLLGFLDKNWNSQGKPFVQLTYG